MSYGSVVLWSVAVLLLEDYLTGDPPLPPQKPSGSIRNSKVRAVEVDGVDFIDARLFKKKKCCAVCFVQFWLFKRQHNCYVCGQPVCWDCSTGSINDRKACDVCFDRYSHLERETKKEKIIGEMQKVAIFYMKAGTLTENARSKMVQFLPNDEIKERTRRTLEEKNQALERRLIQLKLKRQQLLSQLQSESHQLF